MFFLKVRDYRVQFQRLSFVFLCFDKICTGTKSVKKACADLYHENALLKKMKFHFMLLDHYLVVAIISMLPKQTFLEIYLK